jgi:hypothetical protein
MGKVHAVIDLPEEVYLSLSSSGLTRDRIVSESRKLLALKFFSDKILFPGKGDPTLRPVQVGFYRIS